MNPQNQPSDTPRPEAVNKLFQKQMAIATQGSTVIVWPDNNRITEYIRDLEESNKQLRSDLKMCAEALNEISKNIGSSHAANKAERVIANNSRIQAILNEKESDK